MGVVNDKFLGAGLKYGVRRGRNQQDAVSSSLPTLKKTKTEERKENSTTAMALEGRGEERRFGQRLVLWGKDQCPGLASFPFLGEARSFLGSPSIGGCLGQRFRRSAVSLRKFCCQLLLLRRPITLRPGQTALALGFFSTALACVLSWSFLHPIEPNWMDACF